MAIEKERYCNGCDRIFSWADWQEDTCPFCETPLGDRTDIPEGAVPLLNDTLSQEIPWPQGEREGQVCRASGYIDAQMIKAVLESSGIPVLLHGGAKLGLTIGNLGAVPVYVPQSRVAEARKLLEEQPENSGNN